MATQKPLVELIPDIIQHFLKYQDYLQFNLRLYRILEGQVKLEVEESLRREIISPAALRRALERIPSLNILKKGVDKLSKVYLEAPVRMTDSDQDRDIMMGIVRESCLDNVMANANRLLNAQHTFAIEPFIQDGKHQVRTLAGHQFLPFSDDPVNPLKMTVFIKVLGEEMQWLTDRDDQDGNRKDQDKDMHLVHLLALYSDNEFMIIDTNGQIREDKMLEMGVTSTINPFGVIPFIVGSRSAFEIVPFPNQAGLDMSILIPKLLTDLNYAAQFQSHSIIWTKNADLSGQEINPDVVVDLGDRSEENGDPDIGVIKPEVDIDRILKLIEFEVSSYFSSIGIKTSVSGSLSPGKEESGVSKAIDEGDTTAERKVQTEFFREIEYKFWDLMQKVQEVWSREGRLVGGESRLFSDEFIDTFRMKFNEIKPLKTQQQMLEEIKMARELKLLSRKQALRMLNPDFTEDQIEDILEEVDGENKAEMDKMLGQGMGPIGKSDNGDYKEGNQESIEQDPAKNLQSRS
jgi:hypothetical protein